MNKQSSWTILFGLPKRWPEVSQALLAFVLSNNIDVIVDNAMEIARKGAKIEREGAKICVLALSSRFA